MSTETRTGAQVRIRLAALMADRRVTSEALGISANQLSRLKNGDVAFIRLTTVAALCRELQCQPGDLITYG